MMEYAIEEMNLIPLDLQFFAEGEGERRQRPLHRKS